MFILKTLFSAFLFLLMPALLFAQAYPTKPVTLTVATAIGGTTDISTRLLAKAAEKSLGQPFVISCNGGGGGTVAIGILVKERADGYHLVSSAHTPLVVIPQLRAVPYQLDEIVPIMQFAAPQSGLVVRADSPWKTFKEFVTYAKQNPGKVTYTVTGVYNPMHLAMLHIQRQEGIQWTAIPVTGSDPNMPLLGGHVTAYSGLSAWMPHVQAGRFHLLVTHGEKRMKSVPDVPTLRELGYDFINETVYLISTRKGTAPAIMKKLENAFHKAMEDREFVNYMHKSEIAITYKNSEDTKKYLQEAYTRNEKMILDFNIPKEK
jgi:tripartite-type tricarboxylate transporter receptor subunit TctC